MKTTPIDKQTVDWYDQVCQHLDILCNAVQNVQNEPEIPPPVTLFKLVKDDIQNIRRLSGFPTIETPGVWLGPDGQIGLTFENDTDCLDLIFRSEKLVSRLTVGEMTTAIDKNDIPAALLRFSI